MKEILKRIAPVLRRLGFRGSGQNYRKAEGDFVLVINFQGSRWGGEFYVNLGAQPTFAPAEGNADLERLKEYECILRRRVGKAWPWQMDAGTFSQMEKEVEISQATFFAHAQTMREALASAPTDDLLRNFSSGTTQARASLHLARAASTLGLFAVASRLVERGLELAGEKGTLLRADLRRVPLQPTEAAQHGIAPDDRSPSAPARR